MYLERINLREMSLMSNRYNVKAFRYMNYIDDLYIILRSPFENNTQITLK